MRFRHLLALCAVVPLTLSAGDKWIPIAGSVGAFRTDLRVYNPSSTDIQVRMSFLPAGNQDNNSAINSPVTLTIPAKHQAIYDDAVATIFQKSGLGAILLSSDAPLIVSARIYAQTSTGTLGQGFSAISPGSFLRDGELIQLRADNAFRTNIGITNGANAELHLTWALYDKNDALVGEGTTTMPAYGVISPTSITSGFFFNAGNADLSNARVQFHADNPIIVYSSVIDNATTDPTFFYALREDGSN